MPGKTKLPSTLRKSPKKAQDTYEKTLEHAEQEYGDEQRAHRTAWSAVKNSFEKVGDRWEPKGRRGPSDPRSREPHSLKRAGKGRTFGGVDYYGNTKDTLYERAKKLDIHGRSRMTKDELAEAIGRKQR